MQSTRWTDCQTKWPHPTTRRTNSHVPKPVPEAPKPPPPAPNIARAPRDLRVRVVIASACSLTPLLFLSAAVLASLRVPPAVGSSPCRPYSSFPSPGLVWWWGRFARTTQISRGARLRSSEGGGRRSIRNILRNGTHQKIGRTLHSRCMCL